MSKSKGNGSVIESMPTVEAPKPEKAEKAERKTVSYADVATVRVGTMGDKPIECRVQHEKGGTATRLAVGVGYRTWADFKTDDDGVAALCAFVAALIRDESRLPSLRAWLSASSDLLR